MTQITERQHIDAEEVDDKLLDNLFDTKAPSSTYMERI